MLFAIKSMTAAAILAAFLGMAGCGPQAQDLIIRPGDALGTISMYGEDDSLEWTAVGPGGGGHQRWPAISPHDPDLMFVACDMGGFYRSVNGGDTWQMDRVANRASFSPVFDPENPNIVYMGHGFGITNSKGIGQELDAGAFIRRGWEILKSEDKGLTWHPILQKIMPSWGCNSPAFLMLDPARPGYMLTGLNGGQPGRLFRSRNGGGFWMDISDNLPENVNLLGCAVDPASPVAKRLLYLGTNKGIFRSDTDARIWNKIEIPGLKGDILKFDAAMVYRPERFIVLYAIGKLRKEGDTYKGGLLVSKDGGATWEDRTPNVYASLDKGAELNRDFRAIGVNDVNPDIVYLSISGKMPSGRLLGGTYKTEDGGQTWRFSLPGPNSEDIYRRRMAKAPYFTSGWLNEEFSWGWGGHASYMYVCRTDPDHMVRTDSGRTIYTHDGGANWKDGCARKVGDRKWTSRGLEVTTCYDVVFKPDDHDTMYITYTDIGLFKSTDRGHSWTYAMKGPKYRNSMYEMAFDPDNPNKIYGVCSNTHDLPKWSYITKDPVKFTGGFCVSEDAGDSWTMRGEKGGLPVGACYSVTLDPKSPKDKRTLWVCIFGRGIYKSVDDGHTWELKIKGMEYVLQQNGNLYMMSRASDGTLYAAITKQVRLPKDKPRDSRGGALFRSDDGAESWTQIGPVIPKKYSNEPNPLSYIWDVQPSIHNPDIVYAACQIDVHSGTGAPGGLYRSRDKGKTWARIFEGPGSERVGQSKHDRNELYVGSNQGLFRSKDGGNSWVRLVGIPFRNVYRAVADPDKKDQIWVTTFGGGVWKAVPRTAVDKSTSRQVDKPE